MLTLDAVFRFDDAGNMVFRLQYSDGTVFDALSATGATALINGDIHNIIFVWSTQAVAIGIMGFGINSGAYVAEIMRGGINAVDIGQTEAGRSLGLSSAITMKSIVLPQAIKNVLPAIGNEFIALLKETSVIGFLGVIDLTKAAERVISRTADVYFPYLSIAAIYLILVYGLNYLFKKLERRLAKSDRG